MTIRILAFLALLFFLVIGAIRFLGLPFDIFLSFVTVLLASIVALFAHYRYIGRLRASDRISKALFHLTLWRPLLPMEVYFQLQTQLMIESGNEEVALKAIDRADRRGLDQSYLSGLLADLDRRKGRSLKAEKVLLKSLEETPPSVLRTGLLCQLVRLYVHELPSPKNLKKSVELMEEAAEYTSNDAHEALMMAIQGELEQAQGKADESILHLEEALKRLLHDTSGKEQKEGFFTALKRWIAQMTYTEHDEHQFPLFAEFHLSLGRAYVDAGKKDEAKRVFEKGLTLCQQPFVTEQIKAELGRL